MIRDQIKVIRSMPEAPVSARRRDFMRRVSVAAAGLFLFSENDAQAKVFGEDRGLSFHNINTGETLDFVCCPTKPYSARLLRSFSNLLRDHRTGDVMTMDPGLIDILYAVSILTESTGTFHVLSGYRSPDTNAMLHRHSRGVAEHSYHTLGKAIDIRMTDVGTNEIRKISVALQRGGVGYYRSSDFVHLDTGDFRTW